MGKGNKLLTEKAMLTKPIFLATFKTIQILVDVAYTFKYIVDQKLWLIFL